MTSNAGTWRLEVANFPVNQLMFANQTAYRHGSLTINRTDFLERIAEPSIIAYIDVDLAHAGESCRIVHVLDAVTPMVKVQGRSTVYPGFFGSGIPAGEGRNHRLGGTAVVVCATFPQSTSGALAAGETIIDMSGPAAPYCALSDTANVISTCHPAPGINNEEFDDALHRTKLKAAIYLAQATEALAPPSSRNLRISTSRH